MTWIQFSPLEPRTRACMAALPELTTGWKGIACVYFLKVTWQTVSHTAATTIRKEAKTLKKIKNPTNKSLKFSLFLKRELWLFYLWLFYFGFGYCILLLINLSNHRPLGLIVPSQVGTWELTFQRGSYRELCPAAQSHSEVWAGAVLQVQSVLNLKLQVQEWQGDPTRRCSWGQVGSGAGRA